MRNRKCKKKDCWNRTNRSNQLCTVHQNELELKTIRVLTQNKAIYDENI